MRKTSIDENEDNNLEVQEEDSVETEVSNETDSPEDTEE